MKFLLLKTLLLRKKTDEGFTLPIVIAIGLVMVLLSAVNLIQSGEENLNALSQRGTADALAVAEIGVARYRALLNNNRILAIRDLSEWTGTNIVGDATATTPVLTKVCTDINKLQGSGGWADTSSTTGWRNVEAGGNVIGSYRLIGYEYDRDPSDSNDDNGFSQFADDGDPDNDPITPNEPFDATTNNHNDLNNDLESDAKGFLTIQGRDTTGSVAQIEVEIPIGANDQEVTTFAPALWIQQSSGSVANIGNVDINSDGDTTNSEVEDGNIVLYQPGTQGSEGCGNVAKLAGENTITDPRPIPSLTDLTGYNVRTLKGDISTETYTGTPPNGMSYPVNYFNTTTQKIFLGSTLDELNNWTGSANASNKNITPKYGDKQDRYYYKTSASNLVLDQGETIVADGTSRVILYVDGNLEINTGTNPVRLVNSQHSSQTPDNITRSGIARNLEIHVKDDLIIKGSGTLDITGLVRVGGNVNIQGGSTVNVIGSIWTNGWTGNNGTLNIDMDQTTVVDAKTKADKTVNEFNYFITAMERTSAPITYKPTKWQRQEAE